MSTDPLLQRLHGLSWPTPANDRPDPTPGEVWLLTWQNTRAFGLITDVAERTIETAFATTADVGDETTVKVTLPGAGMSFGVWRGIQRTVRTFVLDHRIGALDEDVANTLEDQPHIWSRIVSSLDDRAIIRAELEDEADALAEAEWVPDGADRAVSLTERATELGLRIADVRARLGVAPGAARRILDRVAVPTPDQAASLAEMLRLSVDEVTGPLHLSRDLVTVMDRPRTRPALQAVADQQFHGDEVDARIHGASRTMALAARHQEQGATDWETLLADALHDD